MLNMFPTLELVPSMMYFMTLITMSATSAAAAPGLGGSMKAAKPANSITTLSSTIDRMMSRWRPLSKKLVS